MRILSAIILSFAAIGAAGEEDVEIEKLLVVRTMGLPEKDQKENAKTLLKLIEKKEAAARKQALPEIAGIAMLGFISDDGVLKEEHIQRLRKSEPFLREVLKKHKEMLKIVEEFRKQYAEDDEQVNDIINGLNRVKMYVERLKAVEK